MQQPFLYKQKNASEILLLHKFLFPVNNPVKNKIVSTPIVKLTVHSDPDSPKVSKKLEGSIISQICNLLLGKQIIVIFVF